MKDSHGFSIDSIDNTFSFFLSFFIFDMPVTKFEIILYYHLFQYSNYPMGKRLRGT